eukprot:gene14903-19371_t
MPDDLPFLWDERPESNRARDNNYTPDYVPHMNRIRSEGAVFTQAYTAGPKCAPSRISMLTGRYASRNVYAAEQSGGQMQQTTDRTLVTVPSSKLVGSDVSNTLQKGMLDAHFETIFAGKWHINKRAKGVAPFADYAAATSSVFDSGFSGVGGTYEENIDNAQDFTHNLEWCIATALEKMTAAVDNNRHFFMYVAPTAPHTPSIADALDATIPKSSLRKTPQGTLLEDPVSGMPARNTIADRVAKSSAANLDSNIGAVWVDDALGAVIASLEAQGIMDETLIIVTMDHGQIAKDTLYEGGIRVALMARFPGLILPGTTISTAVSNIDLAPTIFAAIGADLPSDLDGDGISWWKKVTGQSDSQADPIDERKCIVSEIELSRSAVCGSLKFISNWDGDAAGSSQYPASTDAVQFYDLATDPKEQTNLAANNTYSAYVDAFDAFLACHDSATSRNGATRTNCDVSALSLSMATEISHSASGVSSDSEPPGESGSASGSGSVSASGSSSSGSNFINSGSASFDVQLVGSASGTSASGSSITPGPKDDSDAPVKGDSMLDFCNKDCMTCTEKNNAFEDNVDNWKSVRGILCYPQCDYYDDDCRNCERCGDVNGFNPYDDDSWSLGKSPGSASANVIAGGSGSDTATPGEFSGSTSIQIEASGSTIGVEESGLGLPSGSGSVSAGSGGSATVPGSGTSSGSASIQIEASGSTIGVEESGLGLPSGSGSVSAGSGGSATVPGSGTSSGSDSGNSKGGSGSMITEAPSSTEAEPTSPATSTLSTATSTPTYTATAPTETWHTTNGNTTPTTTSTSVCMVTWGLTGDVFQYADGDEVVNECGEKCLCKSGKIIDCCRYRYSYEDLPKSARNTYIAAVLKAKKQDPVFNDLLTMHRNLSRAGIHNANQLLGWHRWYILKVEQQLRMQSTSNSKAEKQGWPVSATCATHPYWASEYFANNLFTDSPANTIWSAHNLGGPRTPGLDGPDPKRPGAGQCVPDGPFRLPEFAINMPNAEGGDAECLRRRHRGRVGSPYDLMLARMRYSAGQYKEWFDGDYRKSDKSGHRGLNSFHGMPHVAIGGHMLSVATSAYDPVFFMHHSNVDLWWQDWQDTTPEHFNAGPLKELLRGTKGVTHKHMLNSSKLLLHKHDSVSYCVKYAPIGTKPLRPGAGGTLVGTVKESNGNRRNAEDGSSNEAGGDESEVEIMNDIEENNMQALPQRETRKAVDILKTLPDSFFAEGGVLTSTSVPRMHAPDIDAYTMWLIQQAEDVGKVVTETDARAEAMEVLAMELEQPTATQTQLAAMSPAEIELSEMLGVSFPHLIKAIKDQQGFGNVAAALENALEEREQARASAPNVASTAASTRTRTTELPSTTEMCDLTSEWICEEEKACCTITKCKTRLESDGPEYEIQAPGIRRDRECARVTSCLPDIEFERRQPTKTSDRDCQPVTVCDQATSFVSREATRTTDRTCTLLGKAPEPTTLSLSLVFAVPKTFDVDAVKEQVKTELLDEVALSVKAYLIRKTTIMLEDIVEVRIFFGNVLWGSSVARRASAEQGEMRVEVIMADNTVESIDTLASAADLMETDLLIGTSSGDDGLVSFATSAGTFSLVATSVVETAVDADDETGGGGPGLHAASIDAASSSGSGSLSTGAAIGIGIGAVAIMLCIVIIAFCIKGKHRNQKVAPAKELEDGGKRRPSTIRTPNQWIAGGVGSNGQHADAAARQHPRASVASLHLQSGSGPPLPFDGGESAGHRRQSIAGFLNHASAVHPAPHPHSQPASPRRASALPPVRRGSVRELPQLRVIEAAQHGQNHEEELEMGAAGISNSESPGYRRGSATSVSLEGNIQAARRRSSSGTLLPPPPSALGLGRRRASLDAPLLPPVTSSSNSEPARGLSEQIKGLASPHSMSKSQRRASIVEKQAELNALLDAEAAAVPDDDGESSDSDDGAFLRQHQRTSQVLRVVSAGHHRQRIASANQRRERQVITQTMLTNRIGKQMSSPQEDLGGVLKFDHDH